jgi:hypothetical protein
MVMSCITVRVFGFAVSLAGICAAILLQLRLIDSGAVTAVFVGHLAAALAAGWYTKRRGRLPAGK